MLRGKAGIVEAARFAVPQRDAAHSGLLLAATNLMRSKLNQFARHHLGFAQIGSVEHPQAGETVICLKNAYLPAGVFVANGMRGTLLDIARTSEDHYTATIEFPDQEGLKIENRKLCLHQFGRQYTFKGVDELPQKPWGWDAAGLLFDFGYGLTTHKAQGSQAERVAVVLESWPNEPDERKRWLYTSVTRAAQSLIMVEP
jgi:exodeoxyribonuclease-5